MKIEMVTAAGIAALCLAGTAQAQIETARRATGVRLATPPIVRPNTVQSVTRDGNSAGRATWIVQRGIIGGQPQSERRRLDWDGPGPDYYGAAEDDFRRVWIQNNNALVTISPWVDQRRRPGADGGLNSKLNAARQQWLRQRGYIGAVRGIRNSRAEAEARRVAVAEFEALPLVTPAGDVIRDKDGKIVPRATIKVPAEATKFRKEMMVRAQELMDERIGEIDRVSRPGWARGDGGRMTLLVARGGELELAGEGEPVDVVVLGPVGRVAGTEEGKSGEGSRSGEGDVGVGAGREAEESPGTVALAD